MDRSVHTMLPCCRRDGGAVLSTNSSPTHYRRIRYVTSCVNGFVPRTRLLSCKACHVWEWRFGSRAGPPSYLGICATFQFHEIYESGYNGNTSLAGPAFVPTTASGLSLVRTDDQADGRLGLWPCSSESAPGQPCSGCSYSPAAREHGSGVSIDSCPDGDRADIRSSCRGGGSWPAVLERCGRRGRRSLLSMDAAAGVPDL